MMSLEHGFLIYSVKSLEHSVFMMYFDQDIVYKMFYCLFHFICFRYGAESLGSEICWGGGSKSCDEYVVCFESISI